jgi:hypothetical protein
MPRARKCLWGIKTQFASREIRICRRNAGFETPHYRAVHGINTPIVDDPRDERPDEDDES